jgi:pimeloyl-ACP methyl ester carboxylesterase
MAGCGQSPEPERSSRTSYSPYSNEQSIQDLKAVIRRCCCNRSSDDNDDDKRIGTTTMSKDSNCVPSSDSSPSPSPLILVGHSYASNLILPLLLEAMEQRRRKRKRHGDSGDDEDSLPLGAISGAVLLSGALRTPSNPLPDGGSSLVTTLPSFLLRCLQPALTASFVGAAFAAGAGPGNNSKGTERDDDCEDSSNVIIARELTDMCNGNSMRVVQAYHSEMKWLSLLHCDNDERNGGGGDTLTTVEGAETDPGVAQENASAAATPPPHLPRVWIVHGREDRIIPLQAGQDMAQVLSRLMAATTVTSASAIASSAAASATLPNNDTEAVVAATPAFHVLDGAGHMIMMEQPRRVATLLLGFLVELSP